MTYLAGQKLAASDLNTLLVQSALTSAYTLTATATDLTGTSVTITTATTGAKYLATWSADYQLTTAGNITGIVQLLVGGVAVTPQAIWNPANVIAGARAVIGNSHIGTLGSAGSYTFKLQGSRVFPSGTTGVIQLNTVHTALSVLILP